MGEKLSGLVGDGSLDGKGVSDDMGKCAFRFRALFRALAFIFPHIHIFECVDMFLRKSAKEKG